MMYMTVRFMNLVLAGNEFGTWAAVHPSLGKLSPPERLRGRASRDLPSSLRDRDRFERA